MERFTDAIVLAKHSLVDDFKRRPDKKFLVLNYTPIAALQQARDDTSLTEEQLSSYQGKFTFIHIGLFSRIRGSEELLHAMVLLKDLPIQVVIIGEFNDGSQDDFFQKAKRLGLADRIIFHEWMPFAEAFQHVMAADAGLIVFQPTSDNNILALPHKMFDYMLAGLPVIAPSFAPEVVDVISESKCGLLVDTSDPNAIAKAMRQLVENPDKASAMGKNGTKAVLERYNWENEASVLVDMYRKIFQEHYG
jgi:glycosyltransferase involved in cell wall biosynthesis